MLVLRAASSLEYLATLFSHLSRTNFERRRRPYDLSPKLTTTYIESHRYESRSSQTSLSPSFEMVFYFSKEDLKKHVFTLTVLHSFHMLTGVFSLCDYS